MKPQLPFWRTIKKPVIGLSPMDGITDPAFRAVSDVIGHPDILYTEFVSADGLVRNKKLLRTFATHKTKTPLVGQLFGKDPKAMEEAATMLIEQTTIVGIDINMGCPSHKVAQHGSGAALIKTPELAESIIFKIRDVITKSKKQIGLSVKTRVGYDTTITTDWISFLTSLPVDAIVLHGRTLKQQYGGRASWEEIQIAAEIAKKRNILLLGNGDIESCAEAKEKIITYAPDGVLIGRSALGNPWVFSEHTPTFTDRIDAAILHCSYFSTLLPEENPITLRKHLGWYIKHIDNAKEIRQSLFHITTVPEAIALLEHIRATFLSSTV
ncbi:MAG: tRNA-dihydrouridine synthase family protein [Microgenomates group bacterium]